MILTPAQVRTLEKCLACVNNNLAKVEYLEAVAEVYPMIKQQVEELRTRIDYLKALSETGLAMHTAMSTSSPA